VAVSLSFWRDRSVFVTGHTGFKGGWLTAWLQRAGARVAGYSLEPSQSPNLFMRARIGNGVASVIDDIRATPRVVDAVFAAAPEIIFHLAAQPLVRASYADPVETFATNVMGTVNVLEAARRVPSVRAVVVITTDKCYEDQNWPWPYRESDPLGGHDPYAGSKACAELVTRSYRDSFLSSRGMGVATARGGNVIGGGDWSRDRLLPDIVAACERDSVVRLRNPEAVRPWQHVLDLLLGYLTLAEKLVEAPARFSGAWNFGPDERSNATVRDVAERVVALWGAGRVELDAPSELHETATLRLDSAKARTALGWKPRLSFEESLQWAVDWYKAAAGGRDARELVDAQLERFEERLEDARVPVLQ
jgi:CDP-glucose 4,6-dehydratase